MRERIKSIREHFGLSQRDLEQLTGIDRNIWRNVEQGKQRVNEDHINALLTHWPQFAYWLTTGKTIPEAGQISPELEQIRENLTTERKATR